MGKYESELKNGPRGVKYATSDIGIYEMPKWEYCKTCLANGWKVRYYPKHTIPSSNESTLASVGGWLRILSNLKIGPRIRVYVTWGMGQASTQGNLGKWEWRMDMAEDGRRHTVWQIAIQLSKRKKVAK